MDDAFVVHLGGELDCAMVACIGEVASYPYLGDANRWGLRRSNFQLLRCPVFIGLRQF